MVKSIMYIYLGKSCDAKVHLGLNKLLWTTVQLINNTKESFFNSLLYMDLTAILIKAQGCET